MENDAATVQRPVFKVLCVDGGGFKGLSAAAALDVIERQNRALAEHFDLLCGTSTGGLIALALAAGKNAAQVVEFYRKCGPRIFPPLSRLKRAAHVCRMLSSEHKHRHSNAALAESIEGKQIRDANSFVCVPALNMTTFAPRIFKTDHDRVLGRDSMLKMSEVALATSAAPTFFPITTCAESSEPQYYADGGMWANNPSLVGVTEALRFFAGRGKPYRSVSLLSIGCASGVSGRMARATYPRWGHDFVREMIEAAGEAQQKATQHYIDFLQESFCVPVKVVRIEVSPLSTAQAKSIALDVATQPAIETLIQLGIDTGHQWKARPEVVEFFTERAPKIGLRAVA